MQSGDHGQEAEARALANALQAALASPSLAEASRAVLREVQAVVPFAFGVVMRLSEDRATVAGLYPGGMAGIEAGVTWSPLDGADRQLWQLGEPSLEAMLQSEATDRSPLTRLPAYGFRSALRVPLFYHGVVVGSAAIYAYEPGAFGAREGIAFEQCVRALGAYLGAPAEPMAAVLVASPEPTETPSSVTTGPLATPTTSPAPPIEAGSTLSEPERLSVLADLVSGVAHELNNPLTTILGYAQLLPTLEGEDGRRAIGTIEQEAQRAGRIVRNLLYFARQHRPRVEPLDLNAVLRRVIDVRRHSAEANNIRLNVFLGAVPAIMGDRHQMEQVFLNLLANAEQALPKGGIVTVESSSEGDTVRVTVTDTGTGIPEALASRIFEPFFSTRGTGEGEGLGLSSAYGIVQAHGGRMAAEPAPDGGARLVVELPLPSQAPVGTSARAGEQAHGRRVLVVEQATAVRALIAAILEPAGYVVRAVASSAEALQVLGEGPVDLVVVGASGAADAALVEQIVQRWPSLHARLLIVTSEEQSRSSSPRVAATLPRPFTSAELLSAVRAVLAAAGD